MSVSQKITGAGIYYSYLLAAMGDVTQYTSPFPRSTSTGQTMVLRSTRPLVPPFGSSWNHMNMFTRLYLEVQAVSQRWRWKTRDHFCHLLDTSRITL